MKKIKIIRSRPLKEVDDEVVDQALTNDKPEELTYESNPLEFILQKYPSLTETLVELLTEDFRDYLNGIYIMAPKPTVFKVVLHNNQYFYLTWMGKTYEAKVSGKKYWLSSIGELERATIEIANLLMLGTAPSTQGPETEMTSASEEETSTITPEETPEEEAPEEIQEGKKGLGIKLLKEAEVSGQDAETLGVALWNASIRGKLPKELSEYKSVYNALGKYTKKYKVPIEKFSGQNITTSDFWKEETGKSSDEPKTDLISINNKLRLSAKKGAAQLMSAEKKEAKATVLAAARTAKIDSTAITNLMKLINNFATSTKTDKLNTGELKKADPKELKSTINIEAKKVINKAEKVQKQLEVELNKLFNSNPTFKLAFAYEAMTGHEKFSDIRGEANFVIAFNNAFTDVKLEDISKLSSPMVKTIADKCNVSVAFKSSSYKIQGEKAGYRFFSSLRLGLDDLLSKEQQLKEALEKENLNEASVIDKIKQFFDYLYNKFNQLIDYISKGLEKLQELIDKGLEAVLEFLGIEINIKFNDVIDFYSAA
jgi:hypothetical protein